MVGAFWVWDRKPNIRAAPNHPKALMLYIICLSGHIIQGLIGAMLQGDMTCMGGGRYTDGWSILGFGQSILQKANIRAAPNQPMALILYNMSFRPLVGLQGLTGATLQGNM